MSSVPSDVRKMADDPTLWHVAGPAEGDSEGRTVQRCLRCDRVLLVLRRKTQLLDVGDEVYGRCDAVVAR